MRWDLSLEGAENVQDVLGGLRAYMTDKTTLQGAANILLRNTQERFRAAVDPEGEPWVVSEAAKRRAIEGRPQDKTLFDTGRLFRSLYAKRVGEFEWEISYNKGGTAPYGTKHNLGLFGLPKRQFIGISSKDERDVMIYLNKRLIDAFNKGTL